MTFYLLLMAIPFLIALIITPMVRRAALRFGVFAVPNHRSMHNGKIPKLGGAAMFLSFVGAAFLCAVLFPARAAFLQLLPASLLLGVTILMILGSFDDKYDLNCNLKLSVEILASLIAVAAGWRIDTAILPGVELDLGWLAWPLTILWIVGVTNAVNISDGLDGLASGVVAIACAVIAIFALHSSTLHTGGAYDNDVMMALFALTLLGSLTGFLIFNFHPAKVFMGDCGSLFVGFTIASISVMCVSKSATLVGLALPALALGVPICDTLLSMLRRFLDRRSLFAPDRGHLHHRMLELGLNQRRAVMVIYAVTLVVAGLGLCLMIGHGLFAVVLFAAALSLIVLLFCAVGVFGLRDTVARFRQKYRSSHRVQEEQRTFESLQLRLRQARGDSAWWPAMCEAAQRMDFAWVSLKTVHPDGRTDIEIWRRPDSPPTDLSRLIMMTVPFRNGDPGCRHELEIAIHVNGSYESAAHRGTLFGRLLDESELSGRSP